MKSKYSSVLPKRYRTSISALLLSCCVVAAPPVAAQDKAQPPLPANPLLLEHSHYFAPEHVYDLRQPTRQNLDVCRDSLEGLTYRVFSAVGYNLANSILLQGPDGGLVVVDTTGSDISANKVLDEFRGALGPGYSHQEMPKLPIKAIVYTHNHIDHTGGVEGILDQADRSACTAEPLSQRGQDGTYIGRQDCVEIISQEQVVEAVVNTNTVVGPILNTRSGYMYGSFIGPNRINNGIGPETDEGTSTFRMPSRTFSQQLLVEAAGLALKLVYVPSETEDELMVFLPDGMNRSYLPGSPAPPAATDDDPWGGPGLLLSAEVIQGPSFPNLYSLRGTGYRNPAQWFRSVDVLRTYDAWGMIPSHGVPLCGHDNIELLLRNFRDAIQFTHDQGMRFMRLGLTPQELAEQISLPEYLLDDLADLETPVEGAPEPADPRDYLRPFYGSISQSLRELYFGYLGWYDADPVNLNPTPSQRKARQTTELMGGSARVLGAAAESLGRGRKQLAQGVADRDSQALEAANADFQWTAELASQIVQGELGISGAKRPVCADLLSNFCQPTLGDDCTAPLPTEATCAGSESFCRAKELKAAAFAGLGQLPMNPNWRDWYISSAMELCGLFDTMPSTTEGLTSRLITAGLPPGAWVNAWTMSLRAEKTMPTGEGATCGPRGDSSDPGQADSGQAGTHAALGFFFESPEPEGSQGYALTIRCAIVEISYLAGPPETWPEEVGTILKISHDDWQKLLQAETDAIKGHDPKLFWTAVGQLPTVRQGAVDAEAFFRDYFDPPPVRLVPLSVPHRVAKAE